MSNEEAKTNRILYVKIRTLSSDSTAVLATMIKNSVPLYSAWGDVRMRLLRNVDDPAQFLQIIEYQTDPELEAPRLYSGSGLERAAEESAILRVE